jgi:O-succinylbenzoic acid--CoA ligase
MNPYPHSSIECNGRRVEINNIINRNAPTYHKFEESLFEFIRAWLTGVDEFTLTTSGSTGAPKNILLTRQQMTMSALLTSQALGLHASQTALICLNPEYIAGKMMIVRSLITGLSIIAVNPASNPLSHVAKFIDFVAMVPLQVHDLLHIGDHEVFNRLGTVIIGGGVIDAHDVGMLKHLSSKFYATYGMTETISHVALRQLNGQGASDHYHALPGILFSLDSRGCLVIHWPALGDPIVTNDLVHLEGNVRFIWLGRWDNVINTGGRKIIPEKLEATIAGSLFSAGIHARFFVSGIPDARLGSKLVMVIEGNSIDQNDNPLREILKLSLQSFEVPKTFLTCRRFKETQTGKINRIETLKLAIAESHSPD